MVRHRPVGAGRRQQALLGDQMRQQLGVVHDLERRAVVGVLVRERVEAVRAGGDDLPYARLGEGRGVLLGEHLEQVLVAHPPRGVAGAALARVRGSPTRYRRRSATEPRSGSSASPDRRTRRRTRPRRGIRAPCSPGCEHVHRDVADPVGSRRRRLAPRVLVRSLDTAEHRARLGREPSTRPSRGSGADRRSCRRARCRRDTPGRTRRRSRSPIRPRRSPRSVPAAAARRCRQPSRRDRSSAT